jgi:hypothetical protein
MFVIRERKIRITAAAIVIDFLSKLAIYCYLAVYRVVVNLNNSGSDSRRNYSSKQGDTSYTHTHVEGDITATNYYSRLDRDSPPFFCPEPF